MQDNGQILASAALPPVKLPPVHRGGGRVGLRTGPEASERRKISVLEIEPRFLGRPSRNVVIIQTGISY